MHRAVAAGPPCAQRLANRAWHPQAGDALTATQ